MKKTLALFIIFIHFVSFSQNESINEVVNDTLIIKDETLLTDLVIEFKRKINLKQKNGKYEVGLEGTNFNRFSDAWEGLKNIPLLQVVDNQPLKINGKIAIVEIDGIRTELSGGDLENYLRSLNSDVIKKVELITNPGSMYDSSVGTVVNIILKKQEEQYRFSVNENAGFKTKPFSYTNLNYSQNFKKLYLYTNYNFGYNTNTSNSEAEIYTPTNGNQNYNVNSNSISRSHNFQLNLAYNLNEKSNIYFSSLFTHGNSYGEGNIQDNNIKKRSDNKSDYDFLRLSQVWKATLNKKLSLKLGSYQILSFSNSNFVAIENSVNQNQRLKNNTPIIIGFVDLALTSKLGVTDFGTRFHSINQSNKNETQINQNFINSPFNYNEKVLSFYLNHSYEINEKNSIVFGLRSESTFSDYSFKNNLISNDFEDKQEYVNLLYNVGYFWNNKKIFQSINFRKQISRPNYSYINPFRSLSEDITQSAGDLDIKPAIQYSLNYEVLINKFVFSLSGSYFNNFISSFTEEEQGVIISTYKNFKTVYFLNTGIEYNNHLFNGKWNIRPALYFTLPKLEDDKYDIKKTSPIFSFSIQNVVDLGNNYMFTLYYNFTSSYKDGLLNHREYQTLNTSFSKKVKNFNFVLYANDIFKTSKSGIETLIDNYSYKSVSYNDARNIGLSIRYTFASKAFKSKETESIDDKTLDRL